MRRSIPAVLVALVATVTVFAVVVEADDGTSSAHNMSLVANYDGEGPEDPYRAGTDMAFWGDRAYVGHLDQGVGPNASPAGGFRILDISDPRNPRLAGRFDCWGDQSDVSVWEDVVVLSVDKPTSADCSSPSGSWEGIRVVSVADEDSPEILTTLATDCGSHTHTLYPDLDNRRLLVYVLSYPLAGRYNPAGAMPGCNPATHRKISVVEIPLDRPQDARVLEHQPSTGPTIGCHDVTVFLERELAAAACLTETQLWDLSEDPAAPRIIGTVRHPEINIHHSTAFSNDGRTLVVGDELGGAAASPGCVGTDRFTPGGLFFFDVGGEKARAPEHRSSFKIPRAQTDLFCTAHLFNVVPRADERDVLVSSWYTGATSVIDFTDPSKPKEIAHMVPTETTTPGEQPAESATWASYWYNGVVYANNFDEDVNSISPRSRGLDVLSVDHEAVRGALRLRRLNPQLQEPFGSYQGKGARPRARAHQ